MIVYNVKRRWFDMKGDAEQYRISQRLPTDDTIKVEINNRKQLAALLNGLCEPPAHGDTDAMKEVPVPSQVIDDAYVDPDLDIPEFLRKSWAKLLCDKSD